MKFPDFNFVYMVQANENVIVPVNLKQSDTYDNQESFFVLVKLLDRGGHLHLLDNIMINGVDMVPEYVKNLDRSRCVCFYPHFPRIDPYSGSIMFSAMNVAYNVSHQHPAGVFDAIARCTAINHDNTSWVTIAELFLLKFNTACAEHNALIVPSVIAYHSKFQSEWISFTGTERHTMDFTANAKLNFEEGRSVLEFMASYMKCALVITTICQNGLGYTAIDCIVPNDLPEINPSYNILVTGGADIFDSLSAYSGDKEEIETENSAAMESVVNDLLVTDRSIWAHNIVPSAIATSATMPFETPASQFLHFVSRCIFYFKLS